MILRQKAHDKCYSRYWKSNMTAVVAPTSLLPYFLMRYLAFPGQMMTLSKRQNGYLNQRVILFRLKYETHSLKMHPKFPCRSVVAPTPNILAQIYALRLVVVPSWYLSILSPSFQPISPSPSSHISSVTIPHLLHRRIHICCPAFTPPCSSAAVFIADLVCHPHYPWATIRPQVGSRSL